MCPGPIFRAPAGLLRPAIAEFEQARSPRVMREGERADEMAIDRIVVSRPRHLQRLGPGLHPISLPTPLAKSLVPTWRPPRNTAKPERARPPRRHHVLNPPRRPAQQAPAEGL